MKKFSEIYTYLGKSFRYDYENKLVQYVYIAEEDDEILDCKKGEIIEIDAVGLRQENWDNIEARNEYLFEYCADLQTEADIETYYDEKIGI